MEIFDVVDENDNVVGQATRDECQHNPKLIHHTAHFTLVDPKTKKILITIRSFFKKTDAGKICFLGEHILSGETYQQATLRGVSEELRNNPTQATEVASNLFKYSQETEISKFFIVPWDGNKLEHDPTEINQLKWVTLQELTTPNSDLSPTTSYWITHIDWEKVLANNFPVG